YKKLKTSKWWNSSTQHAPATAFIAREDDRVDVDMEYDYEQEEGSEQSPWSMSPAINAGLACSMGKTQQTGGASLGPGTAGLEPFAPDSLDDNLEGNDEMRRHKAPEATEAVEMAQTALRYLEDEILSTSAAVDTSLVFPSGQILSSPEQRNRPPPVPNRRSSIPPQKTARFKKAAPCMRRKALINSMYLDIAPADHRTGNNAVLAVSEAVALLRREEGGEAVSGSDNSREGPEKKSKVEMWLEESRIIGNTMAARYRPSVPATRSPTVRLVLTGAERGMAPMSRASASRLGWNTDIERPPPSCSVTKEPNRLSGSHGQEARGKGKPEMNRKKRAGAFSVLGRAIKMAVGGSPKREKPPDPDDAATTTPYPGTQPPKKRRWTTTLTEKYQRIFNRRETRTRHQHNSNINDDNEDSQCTLDPPQRRPNTALGIDRSPYLSDLVPFLPEKEEEQYTPTWIRQNLSGLLFRGEETSSTQRRPASAPCLLDYPIRPPSRHLDGGTGRVSRFVEGEDYRVCLGLPQRGRRSLSEPGRVAEGGMGGFGGDGGGEVRQGRRSRNGSTLVDVESVEEEDEGRSDVSRSTEGGEDGYETANETTSVDGMGVPEVEERESQLTVVGDDSQAHMVELEGRRFAVMV
ncbi:hypothetical protein QBC39DRAFT_406027, partial [Podospora conica]